MMSETPRIRIANVSREHVVSAGQAEARKRLCFARKID